MPTHFEMGRNRWTCHGFSAPITPKQTRWKFRAKEINLTIEGSKASPTKPFIVDFRNEEAVL